MNEKNIKEILPIGSVVQLSGGTKKIMICGRIQEDRKTEKIYDYAACYYPEGILDPNELFLFQHDDIERVYFLGMQGSEEFAFRKFMQNKLKELKML